MRTRVVRENTTDGQRAGYEDEIVSMIRVCLVDDEANVRSSTAKAFDVLQNCLGARAIDQTIPTLLEALRQPGKGAGTGPSGSHGRTYQNLIQVSAQFTPCRSALLQCSPF
jgi:hypothetical protein